jgi:transcription elongation factor SPT6
MLSKLGELKDYAWIWLLIQYSRHLHESQNFGGGAGRTPYGAGTRTPARTPGHVTPGRMSVHQMGRTPNAYVGGATPASVGTPGYPQYGYQTPSSYPSAPSYPQQQAAIPAGMNPARHAMIQSAGGWDQASGSQW